MPKRRLGIEKDRMERQNCKLDGIACECAIYVTFGMVCIVAESRALVDEAKV